VATLSTLTNTVLRESPRGGANVHISSDIGHSRAGPSHTSISVACGGTSAGVLSEKC
jgi:hypothetical protein